MSKKFYWLSLALLWGALTVLLLTWAQGTASAAQSQNNQAVPSEAVMDALKTLLQENPELVLEILRKHSEEVLDIAQQGANQRRQKGFLTQWKQDLTQPKKYDIVDRPMRGPSDAPVTIVAYSDFTCPYCKQAADTIKTLLNTRNGKIRYVFKGFSFNTTGTARKANEYFAAAGLQSPEKAWALYDLLFAQNEELIRQGETFLKQAAAQVGLDMKRLAQDIAGRVVKEQIEDDAQEAVRLGIQGTPYFLVNNLVVRGALPIELFNTAINTALANSK